MTGQSSHTQIKASIFLDDLDPLPNSWGGDSPILALPGAALTKMKSKSQAKTWKEKWKGQIPFSGMEYSFLGMEIPFSF